MGWAVLQSAGNSSGSANPVATYGSNLSRNTKLIAWAINSGGNVTAVKDGAGNSFTLLTTLTNSQSDTGTLWVLDTLTSQVGTKPTITATCSVPANGTSMVIAEVSGLSFGATVATCYDGPAGTATAAPVSGTWTPSFGAYKSGSVQEFLIAVVMDSGDAGSTTTGPSAPYTAMTGNQNGQSASNVNVFYKNSTDGTESAGTWSVTSGSNGYVSILVAFKLAPVYVAPPTPPVPAMPMVAAFGPNTPFNVPTSPVPPPSGSQSVSSSDSGTGTDSQSSQGNISDLSEAGTGTDTGTKIGVADLSEAGTGTETQSVAAAVSGSDSGSGTDSGTQIGVASSDSGSGVESQSVAVLISSSDAGSGTDTGTQIGVASSDAGSGSEAQSVLGNISSADSGTGTDTGTQIGVSSSDSGSGSESQSVASTTQVSSSDTGTGTDTGTQIGVSLGDSGSGSESQSANASLSGSDTGTSSDSGSQVRVSSSDAGTGSDSQFIAVSSLDSGTGADSGSAIGIIDPPDTGTGTEAQSLVVFVSSSDSGTGSESQSVFTGGVMVFDSDFGVGREGDIEYPPDGAFIQAAQVDAGTASEAQSVVAQPAGSDSGTGTESQSVFYLVQAVSDSDAGTGTETWWTDANKSDSDGGTGSDSQVLIYVPTSSDSGTGTDTTPPIVVFSYLPYYMFYIPGTGGLRLVWRPGTPEEREVRRFEQLDWQAIAYAKMISESESLHEVSDADSGSASEDHRPTAAVIQHHSATHIELEASGPQLVMAVTARQLVPIQTA